jgi:hypothetical protein
MHKHRIRTGLFSRDRRHERQLGAVSDDDLILLFDGPDAEIREPAAPMGSRFPAPRVAGGVAERDDDEVLLTLGGTRATIKVKPEPSRPATEADRDHEPPGREHFPLGGVESVDDVERSRRVQAELVARQAAYRANRQNVDELLEWFATSETADAPARALVTHGSGSPRRRPGNQTGIPDKDPAPLWREIKGTPGRPPFSWRRMLASAAISGGLGSAALLALHWVVG